MSLEVSFEAGIDLDMGNVLTQNRVSEAQAMLPDEVKRQGVTVKKEALFSPAPHLTRLAQPDLRRPLSHELLDDQHHRRDRPHSGRGSGGGLRR
jgi:multidrug efflux pump subunit AcrB